MSQVHNSTVQTKNHGLLVKLLHLTLLLSELRTILVEHYRNGKFKGLSSPVSVAQWLTINL